MLSSRTKRDTEPVLTIPSNSTPGIIGGVVGGLACIGTICAAIVFYRSSKRKIPSFENSIVPRVFTSGIVAAASIWKRPLDVQADPPSLGPPSRNYRLFSKRPLMPPATDVEKGASSTHLVVNPLASVAPAQPNPARTPVTAPRVGIEPMGTYTEDDDGDQMVGSQARTDGRLRRDGSRGDVMETEYVRHTDAGTVRVVELPPSYNELQPQE